MAKLIAVALCAVLVISCAAQAFAGIQHVRSESLKDDKATSSSKGSSPTSQAPTSSSTEPSSTTTTTKAPISSSKVTTTVTTAKPTPPHCQPGNRKAVEHTCKEYLECDSQFRWVSKSCSTLCKVFEPKSAKCVWNWQFPCMKPPTTVAPPSPSTEAPTKATSKAPTKGPVTPTTNAPECKDGSVKAIKGNCKDYFTCQSNKWVQTSCSMGYDFDINKLACTWSWWANC